MRFRRRLPIPLAILLIAGALALIVTIRKHAPPEPARLLPGADGFFYVNLSWIRTFATGKLPPVSREPEYQDFIAQTGFQFERDLDKAAFAIHYPKSWGGGTGGSATEPRFSEVFVGKFDSTRLTTYLKKVSSSLEDYHGFDIYSIPLEGRTVRVVMLSYDSVAVSNHPDANVIRGMLDRSRKLASPFGGPWLLRRFYRKVPLASLSFAIFKVRPNEMSSLSGFSGWSLLFPKPAVTVVSGRFIRAFHLRAEAFTDSEADARVVTDKATAFLNIFHAAELSVGTQGTDADVKNFFDSLKVEQSGDRAILTAIVPAGFVRKILEEAPPNAIVPEKSTEPSVAAPAEKRPKKRPAH